MELRPYQCEAVDAVYRHLREQDDNPCVVIPTAGGKTPCLAAISRDAVNLWQGRVLILAHVKELLEQSVAHLNRLLDWDKVGIYSAGLKRRDTAHPIIVAGIQSVYKRACKLDAFDLVLVDEAHMIPPDGDGMYRTFLEEAAKVNPRIRVIGFTATPFRMTTGSICAPENLLNSVCYEIGVRELIVQGYLCKLVTKGGREDVDTQGLHVRAGEFVADEVEALMNQDSRVEAACTEIVDYTRDRRSCLVFASGVAHAEHVAETLRRKGGVVATVFGETSDKDRAKVIADFRGGKLQYLVNVNVLTTGFDAPNVDCVAMLRPTMSPGLYYQMVGRGFRLCEGKADCLVLDFGGNVLRHGPVDDILVQAKGYEGDGEAPAKKCPECHALIAAGYTVCPQCGFEFPPPERRQHDATASTAGILSGQVTVEEYEVQETYYTVHEKRDAPPGHPKTLRVDYLIGWQKYQSEWICLEHGGWAHSKAASWWRQRSNLPPPATVEEAVELAQAGALCQTRHITVRSVTGEKYARIVGYDLGPKPDYREPGWDEEPAAEAAPVGASDDHEEIPF
jgi:DNA repair protein RadD